MSGRNGDKARFDRERKKQIVRKRHTRELRKSLLAGNEEKQAASPESKQ